jgi:hypothetical protein
VGLQRLFSGFGSADIGQCAPAIADLEPPIRVVEHRDPVSCQAAGELGGLEQEQHLVVLQGQVTRDRAVLLPGERGIHVSPSRHLPMQILRTAGWLGKTPVVVRQELREDCIGCLNRAGLMMGSGVMDPGLGSGTEQPL